MNIIEIVLRSHVNAEHNFDFKELNSSRHIHCDNIKCTDNGSTPGKRCTMIPGSHSNMAAWRCLICKQWKMAGSIKERTHWNTEINAAKIFSKPLKK